MRKLWNCTFAGLMVAAAGMAQVVSTPIIPVGVDQVYTTGMISFTSSQTAQLNVLNVAPAPTATTTGGTSTTTAVPCSVQLSFYDSQNRLVKQSAVTTIAPQTAITLDLVTSQVPAASVTTPRIAVRGVVKIEPPASTSSTPTVVFASSCQLFTTLELFDTTSGLTQAFTSDTRNVNTAVVVPLTGILR